MCVCAKDGMRARDLWRKSYKKLQRILDTVFKTKKEGRFMLVQKPRRSDGLYIQNNRKRNFLEGGKMPTT